MSLAVLGEASGQKSDLIQRIKDILEQYAEGTPVLKELLQNSDDAGATEVVVCLDKRRHSPEELADPGLAKYIGPAILFYNNANFTDSDWDALLSIGKSSKKEDTLKTGRFGVGFCSVYHTTDLPSVASGTKLQILDPQLSLDCVKQNPAQPGIKITFGAGSPAVHSNLFDPYRQFCDFDPSKPYNGTIIRLPLREQASEISAEIYTIETVQTQFRQFEQEAVEMLLFLRCLKKVRIMQWEVGEAHPSFIYECAVEKDTFLKGKSEELYGLVQSWRWDDIQNTAPYLFDVKREIQCRHTSGENNTQMWLVCSTLAPPSHIDQDKRPKDPKLKLKLIPFVGVAARAELPNLHTVTGRVYCSLPLPIHTLLPVHVNARFAITLDRRSIWEDKGEKADWNAALLSRIIPETYLRLLSSFPNKDVFSLFPAESSTSFAPMLRALYNGLETSDERLAPITNGPNATFKPLRDVLLVNQDATSQRLVAILGKFDIPACLIPNRVLKALEEHSAKLQFVNSYRVREYFRMHGKDCLSVEDALFVLKHYCGDITPKTIGELYGLHLLPTASGACKAYGPPKRNSPNYYCCDEAEYRLLSKFEKSAASLISNQIPADLITCLLASENINVKKITPEIVASLVSRILPSSTADTASVDREYCTWIEHLWQDYLTHLPKLDKFEGLFLLASPTPGLMCKIKPNSRFFVRSALGESITEELASVIQQLGCHEVVTFDAHLFANHYVLRPNPNELLLALKAALVGCELNHRFEHLPNESKQMLLDFLSTQTVPLDLISFARQLPIFRNYSGEFGPVAHYIPPPVDHISVDLLRGLPEFLDISPGSVVLARALGAKEISSLEFYERFVIPRLDKLSSPVRDSAMLKLLRRLPEISATTKKLLASLQFVTTLSGTISSPAQLYDPQAPLLQALLSRDSFPAPPYTDDDALVHLRHLGLQTVLSAQMLMNLANNITVPHAKALLEYVNSHQSKITSNKSLTTHLLATSWMPVLESSRFAYPDLPHLKVSTLLQPPTRTRSADNELLLSSKYYILDGVLDQKLRESFGWQVSPEDVFDQLLYLAQSNLRTALVNKMAESAYEILARAPAAMITKIKAFNGPWVWCGIHSGFLAPNQTAFYSKTVSSELMPTLPESYTEGYYKFFASCGVPEYFSPEAYSSALSKFAANMGTDNELKEKDLKWIVGVLNEIASDDAHREEVFIPTQSKHLLPSSKVYFDDAKWAPGFQHQDAASLDIVHDTISNEVASKLGASSRRKFLLSQSSGVFGAHGQQVTLLNTIKRKLVDYPEGKGILKELLQNSDDSGATKMIIVWDQRSHGTESLVSNELKDFQGPALCVANDSVFSDEDFKNIQQIENSYKQRDSTKIGKYGVGFNAVYHLTDLPSFVSEDKLIIFDPHTSHLPEWRGSPVTGIEISFAKAQFDDQFQPYRMLGCTMRDSYKGTLFRFPLRTVQQASVSELKKEPITQGDIAAMLKSFVRDGDELLLHLNNVRSLELYKWVAGAEAPSLIWKTFSQKEKYEQLPEAIQTLGHCANLQMEFHYCHIASSANQNNKMVDLKNTWAIVTGRAISGDAFNFAAANSAGPRRLSPEGAVSIRLRDNNGQLFPDTTYSGKVYTFLPLPEEITGLCCHVHGQFEIKSSRSGLEWNQDTSGKDLSRAQWNQVLIRDVIVKLYQCLLFSVRTHSTSEMERYYKQFDLSNISTNWRPFRHAVLRQLWTIPFLHMVSSKDQFIAPSKAIFPHAVPHATIEALLCHMKEPLVAPSALRILYKQFEGDGLVPSSISPERLVAIVKSDLPLFQQFFTGAPEDTKHTVVTVLDYMKKFFTSDPFSMVGFPVVTHSNGLVFIAEFDKNVTSLLLLCDSDQLQLVPAGFRKLVVCKEVRDVLPASRLSPKLNIHPLNGKIFSRLLRPELAKLGDAIFVDLKPSEFPSKEWLAKFWTYAATLQHKLPLEDFESMLLVPVTRGVCKLVRGAPIICAEDTFTTEREDVLFKVSSYVVHSFSASKIRAHPQWNSYFQPNTFDGLLQALHAGKSSTELDSLFSKLSPSELAVLKAMLIAKLPSSPSDQSRNLLRLLPLLQTNYQGMKKVTPFLRELHIPPKMFVEIRQIAPSTTRGPFLMCSSDDLKLADAMGFDRLNDASFLWELMKLILDGSFPADERDKLTGYILDNINSASFKAHHRQLGEFSFVSTAQGGRKGELRKPSELYHPTRCSEASALLLDPCCFPSDNLSGTQLQALILLGLHTEFSPQVLESVVDQIAVQPTASASRARGVKLLELLSDRAQMYNPEQFPALFAKMKTKPCIPLRECPSDYPAVLWKHTASLVPGDQARPISMAHLVSFTRNTVDLDKVHPILQNALGWILPDIQSVMQQLAEMVHIRDVAYAERVAEIAESIYSHLNSNISRIGTEILERLQQMKFVFIQELMECVSVHQLAFSSPLPGVQPYLFSVPPRYAKFKDLWHRLAVPKTFSTDQLLDLLQQIHTAASPIDERTMLLVVAVVEHLAEPGTLSDQHKEKLLVPTIQNTLAHPQKCICNLENGLPVYLKQSGFSELHQKVSVQAAIRFGVKSRGAAALDCRKGGNNIRSFGQHSGLINNINKITRDYPESSVLGELIQNADDAGATEIHFIYDQRQHPTAKLFGNTMKDLQGESLLVYNNKPFASSDFDAISQIAAASKANDTKKTGRFGVGFVASYHLTDTPSFITGDQFCIFDPLRQFVPDATEDEPGARCSLDPIFVSDFADQFSPFEVLGCKPGQPFGGTLFRFPLRKKQSKLKASPNIDMSKLLLDLYNGTYLLFLKNITKITVSQYRGLECLVLYEMSKTVKEVLSNPHATIAGPIPKLVDKLTPNLLQVLASNNSDTYAQITTEETITMRKGNTSETTQTWLACSNISAHEDVVNFMRDHQGKRVPWGGVAVPIGSAVSTAQAFCFLPLNVKVPFAVSINGFFEVSSNRQAIIGHQTSKDNDDTGQWNELLIRHAIAPSYISLLQAGAVLLHHARTSIDWYISLFPATSKDDGLWSLLATAVYELIGDQKLLPTRPSRNIVGAGASVIECSKALYAGPALPEAVESFVVCTGLHAFCILPPMIADRFPHLRRFDAQMCCELLRSYAPLEGSRISFGQKGLNSDLTVLNTEEEILALFKYCYSGCGKNITGLPLLPLASADIGIVGCTEIFMHISSDILPHGKHLFLTPNAIAKLTSYFIRLEDQTSFKLQYLDCTTLEQHLHYALPGVWKNTSHVPWSHVVLPPQWFDSLWEFIQRDLNCLKIFGAWPLIPTNNGLMKLDNHLSVLFLGASCPPPLSELLQRAGCAIFQAYGVKFPTRLLSSPSASGLCRVLGVVPGIESHQFTSQEADMLRLCLEEATKVDVPVVKVLRIFPDTLGRCMAIGNMTWKAITPKAQIELQENFLIEKDRSCKALYLLCEIPRLTTTKFHNYILHQWDQLVATQPDDKQFQCLDIMRVDIEAKASKRKVQISSIKTAQMMREIAFVVTDKKNAPKKKPADLYHPSVEVFAASFELGEGEFPGDEYSTEEWLAFLTKLGLLYNPMTVPIVAIERCAEAICAQIGRLFAAHFDCQQDFNTSLNTVRSRANILMRHAAVDQRKSEKLQQLPYAVVDSEASELPGYCGKARFFSSFADACPKFDVDLVWLNHPALLTAGNVAAARLTQPTVTQIIDNLLKFCAKVAPESWSHDALSGDKIKEVVGRIYSRVMLTNEKSDPEAWAKLRDSKWILVEHGNDPVFVRPADLFEELPNEFPGYFYTLPKDWLIYRRLLSALGMKKQPSCTQILAALETKERDLKGAPLDPNEFATTKQLLEYIATFDNLSEACKGKTIYAPDADRKLIDISQLITKDARFIENNIDYSIASMRFLCDILPAKAIKLGAKSLYKTVQVLPDLDRVGKTTIHREYTQKIGCDEFVTCVTRIVSADRADKLEKYCSRIKDLRGAQVIECEVITNQFIHRETKLNIAKPDAKKPQMAAIDVYKKLIYLSSSCDPKRVDLELAEKLNELLGGAVKSNSMLNLTRLLQAEQSELMQVCEEFNLPTIESTATICPGETLTQHDKQKIRENPLYTFKVGEYVAWRDGEVYRYAMIRKVLSKTVSVNLVSIISTLYDVDVGARYGGTKQLSVFSLFKFSLLKDADEQDYEEDEESASLMQQLLTEDTDEYFSKATPEEKYVVAERIFKATIDDERFKKNSGVVQSFVQNQVRHHVVQARKKKLRLSNSNNNNNTNNNSNYNDEESARIIEQWRDQHDFRTSSALVKLPNAQRPIDLQDAQRAIRQIQNDIETLQFIDGGNASGTKSDLVCFLAHQLTEKALKAAIVCTEYSQHILGQHNLAKLLVNCEGGVNGNRGVRTAVALLEGYYLPTRYYEHHNTPMVTRDAFSKAKADEAVEYSLKAASFIITYVQGKLTL